MADSVMHSAHGAGVNGSSTGRCGTSGLGCHTTLDLHALHARRGGCTLTGCHAADKDMSAAPQDLRRGDRLPHQQGRHALQRDHPHRDRHERDRLGRRHLLRHLRDLPQPGERDGA